MNPAAATSARPHLALFMSSLTGGGIQQSMLTLAGALAEQEAQVDLVVCHANCDNPEDYVPDQVRLVALDRSLWGWGRLSALRADPQAALLLLRPVLFPFKGSTKLRYLPALARYLRQEQPQALLSAATQCNLVAVWARRLAGINLRVVVSERNMLSPLVSRFRHNWRWRYLSPLIRHCYREADVVVAVSAAVAQDLAASTGLPSTRICIVNNPVVTRKLLEQINIPLDHSWLTAEAPPVVLGVCRLVPQKDLATLLRAFARVRAQRPAHLMILGEGPERQALEALGRQLGITADMALPGWIDNPFPYMARAGVMVLPSLWEGLPGVLIQAMACGCPVVATDCPGGSGEILGHGAYGTLVPVGDAEAMARAILKTLDAPVDPKSLNHRAQSFSAEATAHHYLKLLLNREEEGAYADKAPAY